MPQVRYGPDITDDAAQMLNDILQFKDMSKRGGKVNRDVRRRYNRATKMAKQLFGLSDADIQKGRYKDLKTMARYGSDARGGGARIPGRKGTYKSQKLARNKRTGAIMKRSQMDEFERRSKAASDKKIKGRTILDKRDSLGRSALAQQVRAVGGQTLLGRTNPRGLQAAMKRFDRRMARQNKKGGILSDRGTKRTKIRKQLTGGRQDIDMLNISKRPTYGRSGVSGSTGIRGRRVTKPQSAVRAKSANRARKQSVKRAGKRKVRRTKGR